MVSLTFNCWDEQRLNNCVDQVRQNGLGMEVRIGPIRKGRQQEAYFHAIVGAVAKYLGEDAEVTKLRLKYAVLPLEEIHTSDGKKYLHPVSTVNLSKGDYSKLIESALMLAAGLNVRVPSAQYFGLDNYGTEK